MSSSLKSEKQPAVLAVDQGTSSTKALAVGLDGTVLAREVVRISCQHPQPGWVEQDAEEIFVSVEAAVSRLLARVPGPVLSLGLSTQRESAIAWDRKTGKPLGPMLGWQDRRTSERAGELQASGDEQWIRARTGLPVDPMFSALKLEWLLDSVDPDRRRARNGEIAVGTVDSFLMHRLTGQHLIEAGNASRTQLLDIDHLGWDEQLLEMFRIPTQTLPEVVCSNMHLPLHRDLPGDHKLTIDGVLGDSHAALYGHGVRAPGQVKATYGTGSSVMGLLANEPFEVSGLARTIAWQLGSSPAYAFEGNILATGATLLWMGGILGLEPGELTDLAREVETLHGVNLVPAFAGLAAPWWSERAQATLSGFTLGTSRAVLARAAVDAVVLQVEDVLGAAEDAGAPVAVVLADGGPSANDWLMQLQADLSTRTVRRSIVPELSAFGAASLAADSVDAPIVVDPAARHEEFLPELDIAMSSARRHSWQAAVARVLAGPDARSQQDECLLEEGAQR